jgi:hypothetical protein
MTGRRRLYTGEENAARGLFVLRLTAFANLLLATLFLLFFDRAKHDPAFAAVNPFAVDPYDAVGSFGVQLSIACALIAVIRAIRTDLQTDSLYNRFTYTLRAMGVTQLGIIVTVLADLAAVVRFPGVWSGFAEGIVLVSITGLMIVFPSGFTWYLIRLAKRREVCSQNPLTRPQIVPFLVCLALLGAYPSGWREGIAGAILTVLVGMVFLFYAVTLLSNAVFPCPDIPERDLVDDITGIVRSLVPRSVILPDQFDPRKCEWTFLAAASILLGGLIAFAELFGENASHTAPPALCVAALLLTIECAGIFLGYALLRRFLGIVRLAPPVRY